MSDPILDAIVGHPNVDVRLKAVHLLACAGQLETFEQLRQLAVRDGVSEEVKTALLEAMYRLDQEAKLKEHETVEASEADPEPQFETFASETAAPQDDLSFAFELGANSQPEEKPASEMEVTSQSDESEL
jgi:hypothetical protein